MKRQKKDVLYRTPVLAQVIVSGTDDHLDGYFNERLPDGYIRSGRTFQFPAGYQESYLINGKDYNFEGSRSLGEQKLLLEEDLAEERFSENEIVEFLQEIEIEETKIPRYLSLDDSKKWLKNHPEFESEAFRLLGEIENEMQREKNNEIRGRIKKK